MEPLKPVRFRDRPTADLVVVILCAVIATVVIGAMIGAVLLAVYRPSVDLDKVGTRLADVTNTLIGAVVGYLAGRGATAVGSTHDKQHPDGE